jgi:hypothetical protein
MPSVYVAGEVSRKNNANAKLGRIYKQIETRLSTAGFSVQVPVLDRELDAKDAKEFFEEISDRIRKSDLVITVITKRTPSPPTEAAMASFFKKGQIIVVPPGKRPPRILAGLPYLIGIGNYTELEKLLGLIVARGTKRDG